MLPPALIKGYKCGLYENAVLELGVALVSEVLTLDVGRMANNEVVIKCGPFSFTGQAKHMHKPC